jgi:hypothetical protein
MPEISGRGSRDTKRQERNRGVDRLPREKLSFGKGEKASVTPRKTLPMRKTKSMLLGDRPLIDLDLLAAGIISGAEGL